VHLDTTTTYGGNLTFGAVFNTRNGDNIEQPETDATNQIANALTSVKNWPTNDLFTIYSGSASSCKFSLNTSSATAVKAGGTGTVTVADANYCAWLSTSNVSWITVTSGALNSNAGNVGYTVAANSGAQRVGTVTIAGLTFTVTQAGTDVTTTTLAASPNPASVGQQVTLTATVKRTGASGTPGGSVTFSVDGAALATINLNASGVATLSASSNGLAPGAYPVKATYSGDSNDGVSTSAATTVTLQKAKTAVSLTASPNPVTRPANCTLKATVKRSLGAGFATGTVTFTVATTTIASVKLNASGVATLTAPTGGQAAGNYPVIATYAGDASDDSAASTAVTVVLK
jgi:hypothetical protein